jgi:hypothetical protein
VKIGISRQERVPRPVDGILLGGCPERGAVVGLPQNTHYQPGPIMYLARASTFFVLSACLMAVLVLAWAWDSTMAPLLGFLDFAVEHYLLTPAFVLWFLALPCLVGLARSGRRNDGSMAILSLIGAAICVTTGLWVAEASHAQHTTLAETIRHFRMAPAPDSL